ncbi:MAG TPA: ATP-binding protein, partial [Polyangiales bacterium]
MSDITERAALSRRLTLAVAIPVALLIGVGAILWAQIARMSDVAQWVDHTDRVISRIYDVQKQIFDQESAVRGFLLTEEHAYLEPYEHAQPNTLFAELHALVADNPPQQIRVEDAQRRYDVWTRDTSPLARGDVDAATLRARPSMDARRRTIDGLRETMADMLHTELALRSERIAASEQANRDGVIWATLLFIGLTLGIAFVTRTQLKSVTDTYAIALEAERTTRQTVEDQNWVRTEHMKLSKKVQGDLTLAQLGEHALESLANEIGAVIGAFYVAEAGRFRRFAGYALSSDAPDSFGDGEGLIGRAATQRTPLHVRDAPADMLRVRSGVADRAVSELMLVPASVDGMTTAVVEFGFFRAVDARTHELLERIGETIGVAVRSTNQKLRLRELLEESRRQAEELQTQQEELRVANEELQAQSDALRMAHAQLEERKEELETSNSHLISQRDALERVQKDLSDKAVELERASRYKSEFLANMSHELRTPLNSSLILAKLLADNAQENLTPEQVKFASTIYAAGNDLLALINDILDLSKIEAGKVEVNVSATELGRVVAPVVQTFEPVAKQKNLRFSVAIDSSLKLSTDEQRVQQILKNLLSNAFNFTEHGEVGLSAHAGPSGVEFSVHDTGLGIPEHQQEVIFEAFRQADGTTNRRFGGTGLGLSISRDLARMLGGDLTVMSEPGRGSRFTLSLPREFVAPAPAPAR